MFPKISALFGVFLACMVHLSRGGLASLLLPQLREQADIKTISARVVTYNMGEKFNNSKFSWMLGEEDAPDLLMVAFQENSSMGDHDVMSQQIIRSLAGKAEYKFVGGETMKGKMGIVFCVKAAKRQTQCLLFAKKSFVSRVELLGTGQINTTRKFLGSLIATKGACGIVVRIDKTTKIAFFGVHLAAGEKPEDLENRNRDSADILEKLHIKHSDLPENLSWTAKVDLLIVAGDLNYRIHTDRLDKASVATKVSGCTVDGNIGPLLKYDQLSNIRVRRGMHWDGFQEADIKFKPTYKLVPGPKMEYDEKRTSAWTDRIIWHSAGGPAGLQCIVSEYNRIEKAGSDHVPVYADMEIEVRSKKDLKKDLVVEFKDRLVVNKGVMDPNTKKIKQSVETIPESDIKFIACSEPQNVKGQFPGAFSVKAKSASPSSGFIACRLKIGEYESGTAVIPLPLGHPFTMTDPNSGRPISMPYNDFQVPILMGGVFRGWLRGGFTLRGVDPVPLALPNATPEPESQSDDESGETMDGGTGSTSAENDTSGEIEMGGEESANGSSEPETTESGEADSQADNIIEEGGGNLIIGVVVLLLAFGGVGVYYYWFLQQPSESEEKDKDVEEPEDTKAKRQDTKTSAVASVKPKHDSPEKSPGDPSKSPRTKGKKKLKRSKTKGTQASKVSVSGDESFGDDPEDVWNTKKSKDDSPEDLDDKEDIPDYANLFARTVSLNKQNSLALPESNWKTFPRVSGRRTKASMKSSRSKDKSPKSKAKSPRTKPKVKRQKSDRKPNRSRKGTMS